MMGKSILTIAVLACVLTGCLTGFVAGGEVSYDQSEKVQQEAQVEQYLAQASGAGSGTSSPGAASASAAEEPPITGIMAQGETLAEQLAWLTRTADSHNTYILVATADENIAPYEFRYDGAINVTVVLRGDSQNRTIRLQSHGEMFIIRENVTFILDNNITLMGHNGNSGTLVAVRGGTAKMRTGIAITGNSVSDNGGGVYISSGGTFEMSGGTISGNSAGNGGGGVFISSGSFVMTGGTITGNSARRGGGLYNDAPSAIRGGEITGNTASEYGGGVYVSHNFTKSGGTITGYISDQVNGNVVKDADGNVLARRGHAVFVSVDQRKETTAGPNVNLDQNKPDNWNN